MLTRAAFRAFILPALCQKEVIYELRNVFDLNVYLDDLVSEPEISDTERTSAHKDVRHLGGRFDPPGSYSLSGLRISGPNPASSSATSRRVLALCEFYDFCLGDHADYFPGFLVDLQVSPKVAWVMVCNPLRK